MENFNYFQTRLLPHETQGVRTTKTASQPPNRPPASDLGGLIHNPAARISRIDGCGSAATVSSTSPALRARP